MSDRIISSSDDQVTSEIAMLQRRADRNAHAHIRHSLRLQSINEACNFIVTIGGIIIMAASALLLGSDEPYRSAELCVAIISAIITLIGVWQVVLQPGERGRKHKEWSVKFLAVEDSCRLALASGKVETLDGLLTTHLMAVEQADFIPQHRWRARNKPTEMV
jgi:hypothetical protein